MRIILDRLLKRVGVACNSEAGSVSLRVRLAAGAGLTRSRLPRLGRRDRALSLSLSVTVAAAY